MPVYRWNGVRATDSPPMTHPHHRRSVRNRLLASCSRSSSVAWSAVASPAPETGVSPGRGDSWCWVLTSEEPLPLVVALGAGVQRDVTLAAQRAIVAAPVTLRQCDLDCVIADRAGDRVPQPAPDPRGGRAQRRSAP